MCVQVGEGSCPHNAGLRGFARVCADLHGSTHHLTHNEVRSVNVRAYGSSNEVEGELGMISNRYSPNSVFEARVAISKNILTARYLCGREMILEWL